MERQNQTLARFSPPQLERFLSELANLRTDLSALIRFQKSFADLIPPLDKSWFDEVTKERASRLAEIEGALEQYKKDGKAEEFSRVFLGSDPLEVELTKELIELGEGDVEELNVEDTVWVLILRIMLRGLWSEPDYRQREWRVFVIRHHLYSMAQDAFSEKGTLAIFHPEKLIRIPPPMPFEQALLHFVKNADRARYCANSECPAPYFFVKRKNQRYCSEICAAPAQRELKRQWWSEHGEEWRKERAVKKTAKRKTARKGIVSKKTGANNA